MDFTYFYDSFFLIARVVLGYKFEGLINSELLTKLSPILPLTVLKPFIGDETFLSSNILYFYLLLPVKLTKSLNTGLLLIEVGARYVRPGDTGSTS